jgi:hypothetical protein
MAGCCCGCPACGGNLPTSYSVEVHIAFTWQKPICVAGSPQEPPCPSECNFASSTATQSHSFTKTWIVKNANVTACGSEDTVPKCSYAPELGAYEKTCENPFFTTYYKGGLAGTPHFVSTFASVDPNPTCRACVSDGYSLYVDVGPPLITSGSGSGTPETWGCCNCHTIALDVISWAPGNSVECCEGELTVTRIYDVDQHYWFNQNCINTSGDECDCTTFWSGANAVLAQQSFSYPNQECFAGTDETVCFDNFNNPVGGGLVFTRVEDEDGNNPPAECNNHKGLYKILMVNGDCTSSEYTTGNQFAGSWVRVS